MGSMTPLPSFPCWCRATYSWGGETKKDLGFIEGDLIEALNAGDGQWWMGRLRRDPRAIGLFPSNFVEVLDASFQPAPSVSRGASPALQTPPKSNTPVSASVFRKPFQAYGSLTKRGSLDVGVKSREGTPESDREKEKARKSKFRPYSSMKTAQAPNGSLRKTEAAAAAAAMAARAESEDAEQPRIPQPPPRSRRTRGNTAAAAAFAPPTPTRMDSTNAFRTSSPRPGYAEPVRPHSPLPSTFHDGSAYPQILPAERQPSPQRQLQQYHDAAPQYGYEASMAPSPGFDGHEDYTDPSSSPPPPPPPAHRIAYQPSRPASPQQHYEDPYDDEQGTTPPPQPSPGGGMTPSPLRDAMNDVMSSLHDMSMLQYSQPEPPQHTEPTMDNVWSPEAYDLVRSQSRRQAQVQSQHGYGRQDGRFDYDETADRTPSLPSSRDGPPQLDNYVHRMEHQLRHTQSYTSKFPPAPPLKDSQLAGGRPTTSSSTSSTNSHQQFHQQQQQQRDIVRHRKSAYELGGSGNGSLHRTYTTKTNVTNSTESSSATQSSTSTALTSRSIMSGHSAGGFSATSAGSLARRKFGLGSQRSRKALSVIDTRSTPDMGTMARELAPSDTSGSGPSYHESHSSRHQPALTPTADWMRDPLESAGVLGGLSAPSPKTKKNGFLRKMIDSAKTTARTGAANARSTIGSRPGSRSGSVSPTKSLSGGGFGGGGGGAVIGGACAARDMGLAGGAGTEWMQVRRDVNRSNSLSHRERDDRGERCEMLDIPVLNPIDQFLEIAEGDEGLDGLPVAEPMDFNVPNLALVDKSTRFIQSVPPMIGAAALAQSYICRPHRSDVQRLRAIFIWVSERVTWEDDFEGEVDIRRVVQTRRGSSEEIAVLVRDMCSAVGLHAEIVHGYLKSPGEIVDLDTLARPNHWWNTVIVDGEWRIMDCSLAGPTNPHRSAYSSAGSQVAETWYFLARPMEVCYTHIPLLPEQQHIVPPVPHELLVALPCACPTYFRNGVELAEFNTSALYLEQLEMTHLHIQVPEDVECVAEVEARGFAQDADGDVFESGDVITKTALAQPEWTTGRKRFTIKALLPGDEGRGVLKIYAGKRGLMHSIKDNPHSLALALPLSHTGSNPPYDFFVRHPTPHAQRHDLYVAQPQCARLGLNNTFVFCVRQHPSSLSRFTPDTWGSVGGGTGTSSGRPTSPNPFARPSSAMSMVSASASQAGSSFSGSGTGSAAYGDPTTSGTLGGGMTSAQQKPAKLAIQSPSQRITRLTRKVEHGSTAGSRGFGEGSADDDAKGALAGQQGWNSTWETVIKVGERGTWRGLVLADRSARWCVFAEWECV